LTQAVRPGVPVIVGLGGFGADLRHGTPGFGRPENALATLLGAQIARTLGLPFRCSAAVTGARLPDARSGYERMLTALCGWQAGAHLALQAAGTLDCIQSMCFEQFLIDLEIWGYLRRLSAPPVVDEERLALDVIASRPPDYLSCEHTRAHFREELHFPALVPPESYSQWLDGGMNDVVRCAGDQGERLLAAYEPPPLEDSLRRELDGYVASRRAALG
jgi:trimethylamine--corrinoid protein Co-methyltransferase